MRKFIYIFLTFITFSKSFSQELLGQKNTIEITQNWFFERSEFKKIERKEIKVFDKKGRLVKDIEFGFHHNVNLKLVGNIRSYEYQKNKLASEKTYESGTDFKNNQIQFYWNYFYENSRKIKTVSNHSNCEYKYDEKNRLKECVISNWNSEIKRFSLKYNSDNQITEKTQFYGDNIKNWTSTYTKKEDTLVSKQYLFNHPKEKDTTITTVKEVFKNNRLIFSESNDFGICKRRYIYDDKRQLVSVFTKVFDETEKELKTELTYFINGIIKQIRKYELENKNWVLKQRTDIEINGKASILNKKETKKVNEILINREKNWLQQWL
ncbi:hypothetical protein [uncultured Algibacter sp.]|uniref:hypothetical protein n=1 Tax=uncultured Algibacter sp. TaxID=298659 RepID=UPI002631D41A|nr:hypothetical protein [uncultured Algibacter sp.]